MRLFVAIDLDEPARTAIAAEQGRIARAIGDSDRPALRWVSPEHMHLTLVFLGDVAEAQVPALADAVAADLDVHPFLVVFAGLGVFPPRGAPRVMWLGATTGAGEVTNVQRRIAERLQRVGLELEKRPFHPHLTLARWRTSRAIDGRRALAAERGGEVARVYVDHATLHHSRLSSAGPRYTTLARATLT